LRAGEPSGVTAGASLESFASTTVAPTTSAAWPTARTAFWPEPRGLRRSDALRSSKRPQPSTPTNPRSDRRKSPFRVDDETTARSAYQRTCSRVLRCWKPQVLFRPTAKQRLRPRRRESFPRSSHLHTKRHRRSYKRRHARRRQNADYHGQRRGETTRTPISSALFCF